MKKKLTEPLLLIDTPEVRADVLYATGFSAPDDVVILLDGARTWLVVSPMEFQRARKETRGVRVVSSRELILCKETAGSPAEWAAALMLREGVRRCAVPGWMPVAHVRTLEERGLQVSVKAGALVAQRMIKSPKEIDAVKQAQRAAVAAVKKAARTLADASIGRNNVLRHDGKVLTSGRLRTIIETELLAHGCWTPGGTIVSCGEDTADPHAQGEGPLFAHRPIILDVFPRSQKTGYWGDITRTLVKGRIPKESACMHEAVCAARRAALRMMRPGVDAARVHARVTETFQQHGFVTQLSGRKPCGFIHSTGHGVGLDIHEAPRISTVSAELQAGEIITVEPGLYYPGIGGVRVEDTFLITKDGPQCLAPLPLGLNG